MSQDESLVSASKTKPARPRKAKGICQMRDDRGLLKGVTHHFKEDGTVDWRKMVPRTNLYANIQKTQETDISKLKDEDLLIDLKGLRDLAELRGFNSVTYAVVCCSQEFVSVVCSINWIGNFETGGIPVTFQSIADASFKNTVGFASNFLGAIAENRAFARAVRNYLNINIVSREEMKQDKYLDIVGESTQEVGLDPISKLKEILTEQKISWEKLREKLLAEGCVAVKDLVIIDKIPIPIALELIETYKK